MTAPDLFAKPEPPAVPRDFRATEFGGVVAALLRENWLDRSATNINVYSVLRLCSPSVLLQPAGEPGGATNASPGSNHTLRKGRKRNG